MSDGYRELVRYVQELEHRDIGVRLRATPTRALIALVAAELGWRLRAKLKRMFRHE